MTELTFADVAKRIRKKSATEFFGNWDMNQLVDQVTREFTRKSFGYDFRDLKQTLWVKVYELDDWNNEAYVAACLRNAARDFFRKEITYRERHSMCASFDEATEEAVTVNLPKMAGEFLKSGLIMYSVLGELPLEIRDYVELVYVQLTEAERDSVKAYAEGTHQAVDRKRMSRLLEKYGEN